MEFLQAYLGLMLCAAAILAGVRTSFEGPHGAPGAVRLTKRATPRPTTPPALRQAA